MSRKFLPYSGLALVLIAGGLAACNPQQGPGGKADPKAAVKAPPSPYAALAAGKVDVEGGVIEIAARRAGIVSEVYVQEGDMVTKGQILAKQEDRDSVLAVNSSRAAVAQAASRPCSPALPLVAARLHGCHDNLGSRMAAAAYRDADSDPEASWPRGSAFGSGGWCGAREGEVDRGAERSASAGLVLACSTLTSLSGHRCRTRKARLLPVTFVSAGFVDRP
jgi:hypothetical protein